MTDSPASPPPLPPSNSSGTRRLRTHEVQDPIPSAAVGRSMPTRLERALDHARLCARLAADNRAKDVVLLDLRGGTPLVDFFVIASATSQRQSRAIVSEIEREMKKRGERKLGVEGAESGRWALIDYGDFVVHVFSPEARLYYRLEEIWGDAPRLDWQAERIDLSEPVPFVGGGGASQSAATPGGLRDMADLSDDEFDALIAGAEFDEDLQDQDDEEEDGGQESDDLDDLHHEDDDFESGLGRETTRP